MIRSERGSAKPPSSSAAQNRWLRYFLRRPQLERASRRLLRHSSVRAARLQYTCLCHTHGRRPSQWASSTLCKHVYCLWTRHLRARAPNNKAAAWAEKSHMPSRRRLSRASARRPAGRPSESCLSHPKSAFYGLRARARVKLASIRTVSRLNGETFLGGCERRK